MIRIEATIRYAGFLDNEDHEWAPFFFLWSSIKGRQISSFPIKWDPASNKTLGLPTKVHYLVSAANAPGYKKADKKLVLRNDDTLAVRVKVHARSEGGDVSLQNAGDCALIQLAATLARFLREESGNLAKANERIRKLDIRVPLQFYEYETRDGGAVNKGFVQITDLVAYTPEGELLTFDLERDPITGNILPGDEFSLTQENAKMHAATIEAYMERLIKMFTEDANIKHTNFPLATPESKRVHAPFFSTPAGLLPGPTFVVFPGPEAPIQAEQPERWSRVQSWLRMLIDYQLMRICKPASWFIEKAREQLSRTDNTFNDEFVEICDVVGQVIAIPATALPYVSDEVRTGLRPAARLARIRTDAGGFIAYTPPSEGGVHAVERFTEEIENDGGDCEDGAMFAYRVCRTLQMGEWEDDLVRVAALVARQYVPVVNLGSVKDPSVGNDLQSKKLEGAEIIDSPSDLKQAYGAHMWCELVPVAKFVALVKRAVPDLDPNMLWLNGAVKALWVAALPQLVVEATGRIGCLQLPRTSYVLTNERLKAQYVKQQETEKKLLEKILTVTKKMRCMQMVRRQSDLVETPNKRVNKFYRNTMHTFTGAFIPYGFLNIDFYPAQRGPRIPAPFNPTPNPLANVLQMPGKPTEGEQAAPAAVEFDVEHWRDRASFASAGDREWNENEVCAEVVKLLLSLAPPDKPGADYAFECGVPMYDRLKNPLMPSVCLVPGSPMTKREARMVASIMRHNAPMTMPGDFALIDQMHHAAHESLLVNNGVDTTKLLEIQNANYALLKDGVNKVRDALEAKGEKAKGTLLTFLFPFSVLESKEKTESVLDDIKTLDALGFVRSVRVSSEMPVPFRRSVVLQLFCTEPKKN